MTGTKDMRGALTDADRKAVSPTDQVEETRDDLIEQSFGLSFGELDK